MILIYILSLFFGALGAVFISRVGEKIGLLDTPGCRSSHSVPTPKGGGIGILVSILLASIATHQPVSFWLPAIIVSLIGLYGDRIDLSPKLRLVFQFIAAVVLITGTVSFTSHGLFWLLLLPLWAIFIVGTANFYNFMDGINGIAGITGVVGFGLLAFYANLAGGNTPLTQLAVCISFACLGFLPFNMPQAKVFMGDSGSVLLGFVFGAFIFILSERFFDFVCYASLLFPFYMDELSTMIIRLNDGESLTHAHRRHLYQLLANEKGIAHWKISLNYGLLQAAVGICVLLLKPAGIAAVLLFLFLCSSCFLWGSFYIRAQIFSSKGT